MKRIALAVAFLAALVAAPGALADDPSQPAVSAPPAAAADPVDVGASVWIVAS